MNEIRFKIGNMRKEVDWTIYPIDGNYIFVQSDKRALRIDPVNQSGLLSDGKCFPAFLSTTRTMGARRVDIPDEIMEMIEQASKTQSDTVQ